MRAHPYLVLAGTEISNANRFMNYVRNLSGEFGSCGRWEFPDCEITYPVGTDQYTEEYSELYDPTSIVQVSGSCCFCGFIHQPSRAVSHTEPVQALVLDGQVGGYASTPDHADFDITGDIDIRVAVAMYDWTPAASQTLIAKNETAGQHSWRLRVVATTGMLELIHSTDGTALTTHSSTVAPTVADGAGLLVRATMDVNIAGTSRQVLFWTRALNFASMDDDLEADGDWSLLGAPVDTAAVTTIFSSTSKVELGTELAGTAQRLVGRIYGHVVKSGISGTVVSKVDFTDKPAGSTSVNDETGKVWTVAGSATVSTVDSFTTQSVTPADTYISPSADPAPWYDENRPESEDFLGFLATSIVVEPVAVRGVTQRSGEGGVLGGLTLRPRVIAVEGALVAVSCAGMSYGERWLNEALLGTPCADRANCVSADLEMLPVCPEVATEDEATGFFRTLVTVGLVDGPTFSPVNDDEPECETQLVSFQLVAGQPYLFARPERVFTRTVNAP